MRAAGRAAISPSPSASTRSVRCSRGNGRSTSHRRSSSTAAARGSATASSCRTARRCRRSGDRRQPTARPRGAGSGCRAPKRLRGTRTRRRAADLVRGRPMTAPVTASEPRTGELDGHPGVRVRDTKRSPSQNAPRESGYARPVAEATARPRGRPAAASREDVVGAAMHRYLRGQRVDVQAIAAELGLGRTTVYRWFGSREGLIGEVLASCRAACRGRPAKRHGRGGQALLDTFDRFNRSLARPPRCFGSSSRSVTWQSASSPPAGQRAAPHGRAHQRPDRRGGAGAPMSRRSIPPRSPTRSCNWPRRSSSTTRPPGCAATWTACARSRRPCSGCAAPGLTAYTAIAASICAASRRFGAAWVIVRPAGRRGGSRPSAAPSRRSSPRATAPRRCRP